ncbi:MAG: HEAT repeat domain-containing protein [Planctomycetota bacterium]|jgi:HEAT repeat protein
MPRRLWPHLLLGAALTMPACTRSVDEWREALAAEDPFERTMAVIALGQTGDPEVVSDLFAALVDEDEGVGQAARKSLTGMGPVAVPRLLEGLATKVSPGERGRLISATLLIEIGAPAVPPMIEAMRDGSLYDRAPIALTLGRIGRPAVMPLAELLQARDPELAALAARGLGETGRAGRDALPALSKALARPEPAVVIAVASALRAIGPDHRQALLALLSRARTTEGEEHEIVLRAAVRGLVLMRQAARTEQQREAVREDAQRLGAEAIGGLVVALKLEQDELALLAADWLAELGPDVLEPLLGAIGERNVQHIDRTARVVRRLGKPAMPTLLALARDGDPSMRIKAVTAIAALGQDGVEAMPVLLDLLAAEDINLGVAAAWALAQQVPLDEAMLGRVLGAMPAQSAMVRNTLMPCPVNGLLARIDAHPRERDKRLSQLRALGTGAITVLQQQADGDDPHLADQSTRALEALAAQ